MDGHNDQLDDLQQRFDLLVDGELSGEDRRDLLERLEGEPDGWRRCALAFLEAQCWREAMGPAGGASRGRDAGAVAPRRGAEPAAMAVPARDVSRRRHVAWAATLLAMAASFLVAFFLGSLWRAGARDGDRPGGPAPGAVARHEPASPATLSGRALPQWPSLPATEPGPASPITAVTLSLPAGSDGRCESIELPVVERDRVDDGWLGELPAALSPELQRALERAGHRVRQRRDMLRLALPDGRPLIVPVDCVDVDYTAGPPL